MFHADSPLPTAAAAGSPPSAEVLARIVAYFDVFRHPLRRAELRWMAGGAIEPGLEAAVARGWIEADGPWVHRRGQAATVARRRERAAHAERIWPAAMRAGRLLAGLPFVRGVMLTGGLSKQSSEPGGDADFLLLIDPGCVWTTKSTLQVVRRAMPEPLRRLFCTNYLLATDALPLDDQDVFTAFELATAVPLAGAACGELLRANPWTRRWVPGLDWAEQRAALAPAIAAGPSLLAPLARRVDGPLQRRWSRLWDQKYGFLDEDVRARRFKRSPARATNHLHDFRAFVVEGYRERCLACGVDPLQAPLGRPA